MADINPTIPVIRVNGNGTDKSKLPLLKGLKLFTILCPLSCCSFHGLFFWKELY